jgi:poly-gamma-glutamate capsule biosynthesis protein CapA/YwtB (metallophosphatase superfamily)
MTITLAVTGQTLIHQPLDLGGQRDGRLLSFLKADATIANFEGVVEAKGAWPTKTKTVHAVAGSVLESLKHLGFTVMGHANNHAFDLGPPGIAATRLAMEAHTIATCGSAENLPQAMAPARLELNGRKLAVYSFDLGPQADIVYADTGRPGIAPLRMKRTVSLPAGEYASLLSVHQALGDDRRLTARRSVGYTPAAEGDGFEAFGTQFICGKAVEPVWTAVAEDLARVTTAIGCSRSEGDLVVILLHNHHWEPEWSQTPAWFDQLADRLIDAGCDLIIGTGAPVMQPLRFYRERAIVSGLGNFIFHTGRAQTYDDTGVDVWRSAALRLTLDDEGRCRQVSLLPVSVGRPSHTATAPAPSVLAEPDAADIFARMVSRLNADERLRVARHQQ